MLRTLIHLGDSYTIGEGVRPEDRWPSLLCARLRDAGHQLSDPVVVARTGWTSEELAAGLESFLGVSGGGGAKGGGGKAPGSAPPDPGPARAFVAATLQVGVNDQYRGYPVSRYGEAFRRLLARAATLVGASRVVVVSIPDWGVTPFAAEHDRARVASEIDAFNAVNREVARTWGARYADITQLSRRLGADPSMLAEDGLHPSRAQYLRWVDAILPLALQAAGEK